MKWQVLILGVIVTATISCTRDNCTIATATQSGTPCSVWGIKLGNTVYPVESFPEKFKREGVFVCVEYETYSDPRFCACCGGTWARLKSIRYPDE